MQGKVPFVLAFLLLISSCAMISTYDTQRQPEDMIILDRTSVSFQIEKAVYAADRQTYYIWEADSQFIHIIRAGRRINKIGGMGFDKSNFNRLSDICIGADGNLYTLDSFSKTVKKFDHNGQWLREYSLDTLQEPILMDIGRNELFYIFDNIQREIVVLDIEHEEEQFRFGKFQLSRPKQLTNTRNYLLIWDAEENSTMVYDTFGQLLQQKEGFFQIERGNFFQLGSHKISDEGSGKTFLATPKRYHTFLIKNSVGVLTTENDVIVFGISYE